MNLDGLDAPRRLVVLTGNRNPVDIADDVAAYLLKHNQPPALFAMGKTAAVVQDDGTLQPFDADGWLAYVARRVNFTITVKDQTRIVAPPAAAMKILPPVLIPDLPQLAGVANTPYLDANGNVVASDGYHPGSRVYLHVDGLTLPEISARPSRAEVAAAVQLLTGEWLVDFPFAGVADRANAVAVLLTLTGRMFFRLAPLFVFDASTAGSGKGLLATTISLIATGQPPQVMELPRDGEEQRKKITSALLAGQELIMWDESHVIQGRTLAAILTAEKYSDRLLGGNKLISVDNRFTQVALGNNVEVWGDMKRRVVPVRLVPDTEHPEHRSSFRHADLVGWVRIHRGELLAAALTIWRNWIIKGRPEASSMGSFERWARAVGGALEAAGISGFRNNTAEWLSYSDEDDGWGNHIAQLRGRFGERWFTVTDVAEAIDAGFIKRPPVKHDPDKSLAQTLAYGYRGQREKWHGPLRLLRSQERDSATGGRTWSVQLRGSEPAKPSSVSSGSSGEQASPQVGADMAMPDDAAGRSRIVSSGRPISGGKTAGQTMPADHTDDTDDENGAAEFSAWTAGTHGAEANR